MWLPDERSLYDAFGFEWTLLCLDKPGPAAAAFDAAANAVGIDLKVLSCDDEEARDLYESDLVLIRPDQIVAWRRTAASFDPEEVFGIVTGLKVARTQHGSIISAAANGTIWTGAVHGTN